MASKIPDKEVNAHMYITGKTGSGKSSLVLQRIYRQRYKSRLTQDRSLVVLDPHGELTRMIKRFHLAKKYLERIVYIDPTLSIGHTPTINPFECRLKDPLQIDIYANQLIRALEEMLPDAKLSNTMRAVVKPCVHVLLTLNTCTFEDLQDFLKSTEGKWIDHGRRSSIKTYRKFFTEEWNNPHYSRTKQSLYTKLQSLLNSQVFYDMTVGKSTINLERELQKGKILLFNLDKGSIGEEISETLGRFIIAQIKSIALQRAYLPTHLRTPIYFIIDEAHTFIKGNSLNVILQETRKYGLHLILITQNLVSGKEQEKLKRNLINNTNVKMIGANGRATLKALSNETGIPVSDLQNLPFHEFRLSYGARKYRKLKLQNVLWPYSSLFLSSGEMISLSSKLIHHSGYYKPKIKHGPDISTIHELPGFIKSEVSQEFFPKPKFSE